MKTMKIELLPAVIGGVFGIAAGVVGSVTVFLLSDPRSERLEQIQVEQYVSIHRAFSQFLGARFDYVFFVRNYLPDDDAPEGEFEIFEKQSMEYFANLRSATENLGGNLRIAQAIYGDDIDDAIQNFVDWHGAMDQRARMTGPDEWAEQQDYVNWRNRITVEILKYIES